MSFKFPTQTIFYSIENAIKQYRKFSQKNITNHFNDITLDQVLVLTIIKNNPDFSQIDIADMLFKDYASMTRMINLLCKNKYLIRNKNKSDGRRTLLTLSKKGETTIEKLQPIILENRRKALKSISIKEQKALKETLDKLIENCK